MNYLNKISKFIFNLSFFKYVFLILIFSLMCWLSFYLLDMKKINGTEFVALVIGSMFTCLIVNFLDQIQELSIGGNLVKLKDAKSEVEKSIEQLKTFRLETYRYFLSSALQLSGGWGTIGFIDDRAKRFIELYNIIEKAGLSTELKYEIEPIVTNILKGHVRKLLDIDRSGELKRKFLTSPDKFYPADLILLNVSKEIIEDYSNNSAWDLDRTETELTNSIEIYRNLLKIFKDSST